MTPKEFREQLLQRFHNGEVDRDTFIKQYNRPPLRKALSKSKRMEVYKKYNGHCAYCGCELEYKDMQIDHLVPFDEGGDNQELSNLMPSCKQCNYYKSNGSLESLRRDVGCILERLDKQMFIYRLAKKYGLLVETPKEIKFYFEEEKL